jgi:TPR repeat protein
VPQANGQAPNADPAAKDKTEEANVTTNPPKTNDPAANDSKGKDENPLGSVIPSAAAAPTSAPDKGEPAPPEKDSASTANTVDTPEETHLPDHKPSAALLRAQQYLQGRGVQQNCEQGMLYLKAATDKGDPGAAIQMAALYASGHCVKQDRVMAYRWFNSAHELEPANTWIQKNMDRLWAQMTSQERRLAGY